MPSGVYSCTVWCRRAAFQRLLGDRMADVFETELDLEDSAALQSALFGAAYRDRGEYADVTLYRMEVRVPGYSDVVMNYRVNPWPGSGAAW